MGPSYFKAILQNIHKYTSYGLTLKCRLNGGECPNKLGAWKKFQKLINGDQNKRWEGVIFREMAYNCYNATERKTRLP